MHPKRTDEASEFQKPLLDCKCIAGNRVLVSLFLFFLATFLFPVAFRGLNRESSFFCFFFRLFFLPHHTFVPFFCVLVKAATRVCTLFDVLAFPSEPGGCNGISLLENGRNWAASVFCTRDKISGHVKANVKMILSLSGTKSRD